MLQASYLGSGGEKAGLRVISAAVSRPTYATPGHDKGISQSERRGGGRGERGKAVGIQRPPIAHSLYTAIPTLLPTGN